MKTSPTVFRTLVPGPTRCGVCGGFVHELVTRLIDRIGPIPFERVTFTDVCPTCDMIEVRP